MHNRRKISDYENIYEIMKKGLRIRRICIIFLFVCFIAAALVAWMCMIYAEDRGVAILLYIAGFCLAGLLLWTLLMYRTLSPAVLSRADTELPHSVRFQTGGFSAYVTENLLLLVTGAVLNVISLDKIVSMTIKRSNMYKTNYSYYLEIVTREKTYRPSFQRNYRNPDAEQVIADLIREVERRKG